MPEQTRARRLLVLAVCCMSLFIVGLDVTIVNIALPAIRHDLHASVSGLQWTIDAYTLVTASLLTLGGSTADRIGRRRVFQTGLTVFTLASLLCGLAPSLGALIAFRVLQAVGASMLNPVAMSIITNTFLDSKERARAIGVWGATVGISMALGPIVGGALIDSAGWRAIFFINIPVGIAAFVLSALLVPESRAPRPRRTDPLGQLLVFTLLAALTYGIIEGPTAGWTAPEIMGVFAIACLAAAVLVWYEPRREEALLDLRFFRSMPFSGATLLAISGFAGFAGFLFLNALYLQDVRGFSALHAGLYTLPTGLMTVVCAPLSGRLVAARGPRVPLLVAGLAMTASAILLTNLHRGTTTPYLLAAYLIYGLGFGMLNAPITNTAVSGMPVAQAGVAAAIASTSRQVGVSLGVAVVGSAVTSSIRGLLATGFTAASHVGWWIIAGCGLFVLALGILSTSRWAQRTAAQVRTRLATVDDVRTPVGAS
jgi:EmrB/QacA subfamily drug resistance transporter